MGAPTRLRSSVRPSQPLVYAPLGVSSPFPAALSPFPAASQGLPCTSLGPSPSLRRSSGGMERPCQVCESCGVCGPCGVYDISRVRSTFVVPVPLAVSVLLVVLALSVVPVLFVVPVLVVVPSRSSNSSFITSSLLYPVMLSGHNCESLFSSLEIFPVEIYQVVCQGLPPDRLL